MKINQDWTDDRRELKEVVNIGAYEFQAVGSVLHRIPTNNILHVNKSVKGGNGSGADWANAITELSDALRWAHENKDKGLWNKNNPLQIWVAEGVYTPLYMPDYGNGGNDKAVVLRDRTFLLVKDVQLFGGFPSSGSPGMKDRILKDKGGSESILSGDYNRDDGCLGQGRYLKLTNRGENAFHVVVSAGDMGEEAVLDGFTITGGGSDNAGTFIRVNRESFCRACGGGIYVVLTKGSLTFRNLEIVHNMASSSSSYAYGGAVYNENKGDGIIKWINNSIKNNTVSCSSGAAAAFGGGVYNSNSARGTMIWTENVIEHNIAISTSLAYGGGVYNVNAGMMLWSDNIIGYNNADSVARLSYGGGIFNRNTGNMGWHDNKVNGNKATPFGASFNGGGVYNRNAESGVMLWTMEGEVLFREDGNILK
ncbi:hypothetical protein [Sphingobacterium faecale]|uniref:Right-handed parallel beta-helix repeat-containing protein n=1 Tax=Sphingobacterium faecale TaxID=2803775 RepID=A0ABS1R528_9SPHI|nr:hypothetical protein [Sphingobacterium faecale]MBL1409390.1 hypothetical protein [Sphingobacterium faecale]